MNILRKNNCNPATLAGTATGIPGSETGMKCNLSSNIPVSRTVKREGIQYPDLVGVLSPWQASSKTTRKSIVE